MIIGLSGACKSEDLTNLRLEDVEDEGQFIRFIIPNRKTNNYREFFITSGDIPGLNLVEIIRNYINLRADHTEHGRFFVCYRNGKCTRQPVGITGFRAMAKTIASFLKLPDAKKYNGHCFRSSSISARAETGDDFFAVKRYRGFGATNISVGEGYRETSAENWFPYIQN